MGTYARNDQSTRSIVCR